MTENSQSYEIIDQAVAITINMDNKSVECLTRFRIKINNPLLNQRFLQFNGKQFNITDCTLHSSSLYHPEKKKFLKENMDKYFSKDITYVDADMQNKINQEIFQQNCFHNIHNFEEKSQKYENFEDNCLITIYWNVTNEKYNKKMEKIYKKGNKIYFTLDIKTKVDQPQGPCSFQVIQNQFYFIKDSTFGSCRNLFPCKDSIGNYTYFSQIRISIIGKNVKDFTVISSGNKIKENINENTKSFLFEINKKINPTYLGLIIGQFKEININSFITKIYFPSNSQKLSDKEIDSITESIAKMEKQYLQLSNEGKMVLIPGFVYWNLEDMNMNYIFNQIKPYFFYNIFIINEEFFLQENFLEGTSFYYSQFLTYKFLMKTLEKLVMSSIEGFWVLVGICGFLGDKMMHYLNGKASSNYLLYEKRQIYFESIKEGYDQHPINNPHFYNHNQIYYDKYYALKSNLVINLLASNLELDHKTFGVIFWFLTQDLNLTTKEFFRKIKKNFNFKGLNKLLSYAINFTGSINFIVNYSYNRKTNNIDLLIQQKPIILQYFQKNNQERFEAEKFYEYMTDGNKLITSIKKEFNEKIQKYEGIFLDKIKEELKSIVLANEKWKGIKKINQIIPYLLIESSDRIYTSKFNEIKVEDFEQQFAIGLDFKLRKNNNNKKGNDKNTEVMSNIDKISRTEVASIHNSTILYNKMNIEGGEQFSFKLLLDPNWKFLIETFCQESEEVLINQFEKAILQRKDIMFLINFIDSLAQNISPTIISKFCDYIQHNEIDYYLKIQILTIIFKTDYKNEITRIYDIVNNVIQDMKIEEDNTLKLEKFKGIDQMRFFFMLLNVAQNLDSQKNDNTLKDENKEQNDDDLIHLILTLLQKNDNSINKMDDSYYQSFLLKSLLISKNARFFGKVCDEVLRYIKIEYFNKPLSMYIVSVILQYFSQFVYNHMKILHYSMNPKQNRKFSLLEIFTENENLKQILDLFRKLLKIYKKHPLIATIVLKHKLFVKEKFKGYKFIDLVIYSMKYVKKNRERYGSIIGNNLLMEFREFIQSRKNEAKEVYKMTLKSVDSLVNLIWTQQSSSLSIVDSQFRYHYMKIFEIFFDCWIPISFFKKEPQALFPVDRYWLEINNRIDIEKFFNKEQKNVVFKYLSLQKKTKKGLIKAQSQDHQYKIRDLIYQHFKVNKETITKRNIAKHIISILLIEKITMNIENQIQLFINQNQDHVFRTNVYSMKDIKKKLVKSDIASLEDLKIEIYCVVDSYRINDFIDDEVYMEYINFVNLLIAEADSILKEKQEIEKKTAEVMNVKLDMIEAQIKYQ